MGDASRSRHKFEAKLAEHGVGKHYVTCASGTEVSLTVLMALDVKPGDEVITTPFSFAATAAMIVLLGARPVFMDVESDSCSIEERRTESAVIPQTRAIMPVWLYG